jgi:hypothetical protein
VPSAAIAAAAAADGSSGGYTDLEVNNIKKVTAARLLESKLTIPHYYLTMECQVGLRGLSVGYCSGFRFCRASCLLGQVRTGVMFGRRQV